MKTMVLELRQYKLHPGQRDVLIALFEREFIESQEALGMRLVGQFRDRNDPTRFTWIREFPNMPERERANLGQKPGSSHTDGHSPAIPGTCC